MFCPTGLDSVKVKKAHSGGFEFTAQGGLGEFAARGSFLAGKAPMLHLESSLTPSEELRITATPRDLCVLDVKLNPYHGVGRLFTCQTGNAAAQSFFSALEGKGGTVFYFQNLSALRAYFDHSGAKFESCVEGEWPEAGFALPEGRVPLKPGTCYPICDSFVEIGPCVMESEVGSALMFLDALARIYPLLPQPPAEFYDWPEAAKKTLQALNENPGCTRSVRGKLFLEAYVGSSNKPPEGMVQGALIIPLTEYGAWRKRPLPLVEKLQHVPEAFFDPKLKIPIRWLPGVDFTEEKEARSEEEERYRMDSWYLLHTLMNLGRMGEMGSESARRVFMNSLPELIGIARHFDYDWPVFFDQRNLEVFKEETQPGEGGEQDAGGLYVKIMLQAYLLTHKQEYLDEAEICTGKMTKLAFGVLYQTNNTVMGAVAFARLWRETGNTTYKDLSIVSLASTFSHLWLWHFGKDTMTYMGLPPLHDAPYLAFYEEAEILAGFQAYQEEMREDLPESLGLLMAEYQKHLLARGKFYFPPELAEKQVTQEPKEGVMKPRTWIPLEGLGVPGEKAGTVGQAVYAAAAPFILTTRCWRRATGVPFTIYCDYPIFDFEFSGVKKEGQTSFRIGGSGQLPCSLRIIPDRGAKVSLSMQVNEKPIRLGHRKNDAPLTVDISGKTRVEIIWQPPNSN